MMTKSNLSFPLFDYVTLLLVILLGSIFFLQTMRPLRRWVCRKFRHAILNTVVAAPAAVILRLAIFPVAYSAAVWARNTQFGLSYLFSIPIIIQYGLIFVAMDLSFYYWHILNHRVPFLWRFHNVHHIDLDLEVTTAFRFHFGEMIFSIGFRALQVIVLGVPPELFFIYEGVFQAATEFHHSNVRLPIRLERGLVRIIVTPRMHGIHHSIVEEETNSNFSIIFSFWDRLHRTVRLNIPQNEITIGIPAYQDPSYQKITRLLALPFGRQKTYWLATDGSKPSRKRQEGSDPTFLAA